MGLTRKCEDSRAWQRAQGKSPVAACVSSGASQITTSPSLRIPEVAPANLAVGETELGGNAVVLLDLRIFARRDDSAREPSKPGGKANARELTAEN